MSDITCPECSKTFTRPYDLKRHMTNFHVSESLDSPQSKNMAQSLPVQDTRNVPDGHEPIKLKHPFTMCVSGPTSSGKTHLVKEILEKGVISPRPKRIIRMYKRWQHTYSEMKRSVHPSIEFVQGIPGDLEKDEYLNVKVRNLIVLDDIMSTATKDQRVTDLSKCTNTVAAN